jgi:hypothetical protein
VSADVGDCECEFVSLQSVEEDDEKGVTEEVEVKKGGSWLGAEESVTADRAEVRVDISSLEGNKTKAGWSLSSCDKVGCTRGDDELVRTCDTGIAYALEEEECFA